MHSYVFYACVKYSKTGDKNVQLVLRLDFSRGVRYSWEILVGVCRPVLQAAPNFRPKNAILHTRFQTWPQTLLARFQTWNYLD